MSVLAEKKILASVIDMIGEHVALSPLRAYLSITDEKCHDVGSVSSFIA